MINNLVRLLKIAKEYKLWILSASLIGFLTIGSSIGLMMTSAYIIAKAALHPSIAELQIGIVGVRFFGISRGIFRYLERYISHEVTFKLLAKFRVWFFKTIEPLVPSKISYFKSGDLLNRAVSNVENLEHFYVRVLAPPLVAVFILILFFFLFGMFSFYYSAIITFFFLSAGLGVPLFTYKLSKNIGGKLIKLQKQLSELSIDLTQGLAELWVFGQNDNFHKNYLNVNKQYTSMQRRMALISALNDSLIGLLMNFTVIVLMIIAIPDVTSNLLEGVYLSVLVLGTMAVFEAVLPLPNTVQYLEKTTESAKLLFELEDIKPILKVKERQSVIPEDFTIRFHSVNFSYNPDEKLFKDLSFEIPQNKLTAIVGTSGAGKSTLINLLLKFWDYEGKISIGGINLDDIKQNDVIKLFSVSKQKAHLFNLSIKENMRFADEKADNDKIIEAAKTAYIHNFIESLPNKYDELIGEQGLRLSGGERQRLAIARSLLKDSPIMIFDEPTSDLDPVTEADLMNSFYKLSINKTVVLITHRLAHLQRADKIIVIKKGEILEEGSFNQLEKNNGYFKDLLTAQTNLIF